MSFEAAEKGLKIQFDPPAEELALRADAGRTKQVLINLVGNALKFTPRGGSIDPGYRQCHAGGRRTIAPRKRRR